MDAKSAKAVPITWYLAARRVFPASCRWDDFWYLSPLRREKTPSFKVNASKNLWYDHGAGRGGTVIDLAIELEGLSGAGEAIRSISLSHPSYAAAATGPLRTYAQGAGKAQGEADDAAAEGQRWAGSAMGAMELVGIGPIASRALVGYLEEERGISLGIAAEYVVEAHYRSPDGRERCSLWFRNGQGGIELRSAGFKGCLGKKGITVLYGRAPAGRVRVFEWFMDFLSAQVLWPEEADEPAIVMNSVALAEQAAAAAGASGLIARLYLDGDPAGDAWTRRLLLALPGSEDCRARFAPAKDVNEYLTSRSRGAGLTDG